MVCKIFADFFTDRQGTPSSGGNARFIRQAQIHDEASTMFERPSQTRTNEPGSPTEDPSKIRAAAAKISQDPSRQIPHYEVLQPLFGAVSLDSPRKRSANIYPL
jgi:hypothetical protein